MQFQTGETTSQVTSMDAGDERLLVVDFGTLLFISRLGFVPEHKCAATAIAFGLDRDFEVTTHSGVSRNRCLMAEPGIVRSVNGFDGRMAVCLIDPGLEINGLAESAALTVLSRMTATTVAKEWPRFLEALRSPRPPSVDPRVVTASDTLRRSPSETVSAEAIAKAVGLSTSRLEHLFKEQIGTPMRSFRTWCRFHAAAVALATGCDLTRAAQEAGFYDQAHFTNTFRQWFGITPSFVFSSGLSIHVMGRA